MKPETRRALLFPACVAGAVAASLIRPATFGTWIGYDLTGLIVPLIQVIMLGMGATLGPEDFARVVRQPVPVAIGLVLHFTVMPGLGWTLANLFHLEAEIAAGVILVGSCSAGVASNVITYLARGNVPLSVTMTLCSTLAAPLMTPWLMRLLAGRFVPIDMFEMFLSILDLIVLPVLVGLVANRVLFGRWRWSGRVGGLAALSAFTLAGAVAAACMPEATFGLLKTMRGGIVLGFGFLALVAAVKLILNVMLGWTDDWLNRLLPLVSMAGICLIIAIITARSREKLLEAGLVLFVIAALHNGLGYLLGYGGARLARLSERDCRTVAIEVGMQNAGMATGLAVNVLHSTAAALPSVIFGPWMNISGALLASRWQARPPRLTR